MNICLEDNDLIICPNKYKEYLLMNNNKLVDVKFITIEEFKNNYFGTYKKEAIYFLHKTYNLNIDVAKEYLDNIFYNYEPLNEYYNVLKDNGYLVFNNLFKDELNNRNIKVLGYYYLDEYLVKIFNNLNAVFVNVEMGDLKPDIYEFETEDEEVNYIINDIIDKELDLNNVYIVNASESHKLKLNRVNSLYNIPINISNKKSIYSTMIVKQFLNSLKETKNIEDSLKDLKKGDIYNAIVRLINQFSIEYIDDYYINYLENELKNMTINIPLYKNAINIIDYDDIFNKNNYYYFIGFNEGSVPKTILDDELIKDNKRISLGLLTSLEKIKLEKDKIKKIISSYPNMIITYRKSNSNDTFLPSPIIKELSLNVNSMNFNVSNYSNLYNKLLYAKYLDNYLKYNEKNNLISDLKATYNDLPYLKYDNRFNGIDNKVLLKYLNNKTNLSYSSMDNYYHCAFRFYIANILKLDPFQDTFNTFIGNLYHFCLSHMYDEDFDLKSLYLEYLRDKDLTNKERYYVDKLYSNLEFIVDTIKKQDRHSSFNSVLTEQHISIDKTHNINVNFLGFVDKIKYLEKDNKMYIAIIDYKTGEIKTDLNNINYGLHLQLPVYIYLTNKGLKKDIKITGFYLQKILNNKSLNNNELDEEKKLKLDGYTISDEEIINLFDDTYINSDIIKGMKLTSNGFSAYTKLFNDSDINKIIKIVDRLIDNVVDNIEKGNFIINPKRIDNELIGCNYCHFKDLCYRKEEDIVDLENKSFRSIMEED